MPLWGNTDAADSSVISAPAQFNQAPTRANANLLYGNTTLSGVVAGEIVGMYGVDTTEMAVGTGPVIDGVITFAGSGYRSNSTVAFTSNNTGSSAAANAQSNASGKIIDIKISTNGSGYTTSPIITIAAPTAQTFPGNTTAVQVGNTTNTGWITLGTNAPFFTNNDVVTYLVDTANTALGGLANNTAYFVLTVNSTAIQLKSDPLAAAAINISSVPTSAQAGHSITGETATGVVTVGGAKNKGIAHAGWVVRTEGTGGRAGRVQYETLVAMGSMSSDGSDDNQLPDA
jgi:hypothetical protein